MGSSASKKKIVSKSRVPDGQKEGSQDVYDYILSSECPIQINSIIPASNPNPNSHFPVPSSSSTSSFYSKYLTPSSPLWSPLSLLDQSGSSLLFFDLPSSSLTPLSLVISPNSRLLPISPTCLLLTSFTSCLLVSLPFLKQTPVLSLSTPRVNHSVVLFHDKVLVTGGEAHNCELKSCEIFDGQYWENVSEMNEARSWHSSIFHLGAVYVFGGIRNNSIERLIGKWEMLNVKMQWNLNRVGLAPISQRILVAGGEVIGVGYSQAAWEFDGGKERLIKTKICPTQALFYAQGGNFQGRAVLVGMGLRIWYDERFKEWQVDQ